MLQPLSRLSNMQQKGGNGAVGLLLQGATPGDEEKEGYGVPKVRPLGIYEMVVRDTDQTIACINKPWSRP